MKNEIHSKVHYVVCSFLLRSPHLNAVPVRKAPCPLSLKELCGHRKRDPGESPCCIGNSHSARQLRYPQLANPSFVASRRTKAV